MFNIKVNLHTYLEAHPESDLVYRSGMVSFFVFGSLGACERLARSFESQIEGSNGCMREDYLHEHCE